MRKFVNERILQTLLSVLCFLNVRSTVTMHGIDPFSFELLGLQRGNFHEGDIGAGHLDSHDAGLGDSLEESPRSKTPVKPKSHLEFYDSYDLRQRSTNSDQRLSFQVEGQDLSRGGVVSVRSPSYEQPILKVNQNAAVLHIDNERAPRFLFANDGRVLARDHAPQPLSEQEKIFYRTIFSKMAEQRARYSSQSLTPDQEQIKQYCLEAINHALVELHGLETLPGSDRAKILEMQKNIEKMIGQMSEVITGISAAQGHGLSGDLADVSNLGDFGAGAGATVRGLPATDISVRPVGVIPADQKGDVIRANDQEIDTFLAELGLQRSAMTDFEGKEDTKFLRMALRTINDIEHQTRQKLDTGQIDTVVRWQETALTQLQVMVAKQRISEAIGYSDKMVGELKDLIKIKRKMLTGKALEIVKGDALARFEKITTYYLKQIKNARKKINSVSVYGDFTGFEAELATEVTKLSELESELTFYLNSIRVVRPEAEPLKPVTFVPTIRAESSELAPVHTVDEPKTVMQSAPTVTQEARLKQLVDAKISSQFKAGAALDETQLLITNYLTQDEGVMSLVKSLQDLEAQKEQKPRTLGDIFGSGDKSSQELAKEIVQRKAALEERIALVAKQLQRVQAMLEKTKPAYDFSRVRLELEKEQKGWTARFSSARREQLEISVKLLDVLYKRQQEIAVVRLHQLEGFLKQQEISSLIHAMSMEKLQEEYKKLGEMVVQVDGFGSFLPSKPDLFKQREAVLSGLKELQIQLNIEIGSRLLKPFEDGVSQGLEQLSGMPVKDLRKIDDELNNAIAQVNALKSSLIDAKLLQKQAAVLLELNELKKKITAELVRKRWPFKNALDEAEEIVKNSRSFLSTSFLKESIKEEIMKKYQQKIKKSLARLNALQIPEDYFDLEVKRFLLIDMLKKELIFYRKRFISLDFSSGDEQNSDGDKKKKVDHGE